MERKGASAGVVDLFHDANTATSVAARIVPVVVDFTDRPNRSLMKFLSVIK